MTEFKEVDAEKPVRIRAGETFDIVLQESPTTGFRWKIVADGEPCCRLSGDHFAPGSLPGAGGIHRWNFQAMQPGESRIEMILERPGTVSTTAGRTFALSLTVTA